jgi:hypothetical protein
MDSIATKHISQYCRTIKEKIEGILYYDFLIPHPLAAGSFIVM